MAKARAQIRANGLIIGSSASGAVREISGHDHTAGMLATSVGAAPALNSEGSARSTASRTRSVTRILVKRQNAVSVLIKLPFSASLFTGSPPPQTLKYSQVSRHL